MLVVHGNWSAGALHLWAESPAAWLDVVGADRHASDDRRHPFAASGSELAQALIDTGLLAADDLEPAAGNGDGLSMRLPRTNGHPAPSDRLAGVVEVGDLGADMSLDEFTVPSIALRSDAVIPALLRQETRGPTDDIEFSHALRYWMAVARVVVELLADQRLVPTVIRTRGADLTAAWHPWLHDVPARSRVAALLGGMPPVVRAVVDEHAGRPWPILDEALRTMTDAAVRRALGEDDYIDAIEGREDDDDLHVAWLTGLLGEEDRVDVPAAAATELLRDVGQWIAVLDEGAQERPFRLCVRLEEPPEASLPGDLEPIGDAVRWRLSLHLTSSGEDAVEIDADQIWSDPAAAHAVAGGVGRKLDELLLAEMGRAGRVYPRLEAALSEAQPTGADLTTAEASSFLREYKDLLEESGFAVRVPEWWGQPSARIGARLQIEAPESPLAGAAGSAAAGTSLLGLRTLVQYRWQVAVGDQPLTPEEFQRLARSAGAGSLVRLHGRWVELPPKEMADAAAFLESRPEGEMPLLEAIRLAHGAGGTGFGLPVFGMDADGWVGDLLGASSGAGCMPRLEQPGGFLGTLRPYQEVGLSWLSFLDGFGLGACLADDMGLGKTIQLIALMQYERQRPDPPEPPGPTLLIVPTSVVSNWSRELARFAPELSVHVHHGPARPVGDQLIEIASRSDVVITTYTLVSRDRETLTRMSWYRVALDEAQYIKNPPTKQTATIKALNTTRRVALTGTPVENRLSELWSIMEFCNPGYLGQAGEFRRRFSVPIERHRDQSRAEQLRQLVRPFVLRRLKTDPTVIDDLPPCVITKEYATLTREQAALYEQAVSHMLGRVGQAEGVQRRGLVLATLVKLKQICNHPAQLSDEGGTGADVDRHVAELLSKRSGKTRRLMAMLEEVLATGDKALLFTQFRRMGHLLAAMIKHDLDTDVMFLHGGTPPARRQQMIDRFQDPEGGVPIFVLSLKAGGIGVNLTAANHVFHFDRWWNPAVENQATDRAFRIGQTRTVHVHKFVCMGTLEERIDQMIEQKTELAQNIVGAGEDWLTDLSTVRLRELLTLRQSAMENEP